MTEKQDVGRDSFFFWSGHAREGRERDVAELLNKMVRAAAAQPGCLHVNLFQSIRDRRRFMVQSHWRDASFFESYVKSAAFTTTVDRLQPMLVEPGNLTSMYCIGSLDA